MLSLKNSCNLAPALDIKPNIATVPTSKIIQYRNFHRNVGAQRASGTRVHIWDTVDEEEKLEAGLPGPKKI